MSARILNPAFLSPLCCLRACNQAHQHGLIPLVPQYLPVVSSVFPKDWKPVRQLWTARSTLPQSELPGLGHFVQSNAQRPISMLAQGSSLISDTYKYLSGGPFLFNFVHKKVKQWDLGTPLNKAECQNQWKAFLSFNPRAEQAEAGYYAQRMFCVVKGTPQLCHPSTGKSYGAMWHRVTLKQLFSTPR